VAIAGGSGAVMLVLILVVEGLAVLLRRHVR
jgi:hypothetical protein